MSFTVRARVSFCFGFAFALRMISDFTIGEYFTKTTKSG